MTNPKIVIGVSILLVLVALAILGPTLVQVMFPEEDPLDLLAFRPYEPASAEHWLGIDYEGKDAMAVLLVSIRPTLLIGLIAGGVATTIGVAIGLFSGYVSGRVDTFLLLFTDVVLVFPVLPLLLIMALFIPRWDLVRMALLLGAFGWPFVARVIRGQVLSLRERAYVDLAHLSGENHFEIIFLELLPGLLPYIFYSLSAAIVGAMLAEAGLQFLGIGARGLPTLGFMIAKGFRMGLIGMKLSGQIMLPAAVLVLIFAVFQLINMGLDEIFNPRLRMTIDEG